ncbi:MAG: DUF1259 domain-containing protein [Gemmatimonadetes bacterium]|nr:DUF1259 domain-containing protein [Gemmatimonadota bacterium]
MIIRRSRLLASAMCAALAAISVASGAASGQTPDWSPIDSIIGRAGAAQAGGVRRFNFPRSDLQVVVDGVTLSPAFALGGWIAFSGTPSNAMAMGDLVLTGDEVNPVITALQAGGVEQTAIHHHVLRESPHVYYMHVSARGDARKIAAAVRAAVAQTKIPAAGGARPAPSGSGSAGTGAELSMDTAGVGAALGRTGRFNGSIFQVSVPRAETIRDGSMVIPPAMGISTAINFQPTGGGHAAITGDFVLLGSEVNPVIRALRTHGIEVTSVHNHMLNDEPRLFFLHFWANADAVTLAKGLRAALDATNSRRAER